MAYVALSRVRSLDGLHLTEFNAASIIVSSASLEANRLCCLYRKDLQCYKIPEKCSVKSVKRKFDCMVNGNAQKPKAKKPLVSSYKKRTTGKKRPAPSPSTIRNKVNKEGSGDCLLTSAEGLGRIEYPNF